MGNPYINDASTFLVGTVFGIYILLVTIRLLFQWFRVDFYNPVSQFIVKATQPPLRHMRRVIPPLGRLDTASVVLALVLKMVELYITFVLVGNPTGMLGVCVVAISQLVSLILNVFFFAIFIQVILSWVNPGLYNPMTSLLRSLTEPTLRPARRMIPPMGGLDLSPMVVLVVLQLGQYLVVAPIRDIGQKLL